MSYLIGLAVLCVLIVVHEAGHFLLAKWHRVGVLAFAIGFGPILWKRTVGETTYSLRALPLGGFVRMVGDDPRMLQATNVTEMAEETESDALEKVELEPQQRALLADKSRWFLLKGFWPKFWIVLAGPAFNLIFAALLYIGTFMVLGEFANRPVIGEVVAGQPAAVAGVQAGDYVKSVNGTPMKSWVEFSTAIKESDGKPLTLDIVRGGTWQDDALQGGQAVSVGVTPQIDEVPVLADDGTEEIKKFYRIGVAADDARVAITPWHAAKLGVQWTWETTRMVVLSLKALVLGKLSVKQISGPIGILKHAGESADRGPSGILVVMAYISISLAVLNLLPIPVLDGGHIVFFIVEALRGSPVTLRMRELANGVGMALLLALMVFALGNDIWRVVLGNQ